MESQQIETYKCYYCATKFDKIDNIVEHCQKTHSHDVLKYRQIILEDQSGELKYQTKIHEGIVPYELEKSGRNLYIQDNSIFIVDNISKRKRLNTPIKEKCRKKLQFEAQPGYVSASDLQYNITDIDDRLISSVEQLCCADTSFNKCDEEQEENSELLQELYSMLPTVLKNLAEVGQKDAFIRFIDLVHSDQFPLQNICYLLFLDLVDWHSYENTVHMRYRPETVKFWQIGYRLFHGKFLRFMSGLRNLGQILNKESEKGHFDPLKSKVNFVVPSRNNLYKQDDRIPPFFPGINETAIVAISSHYARKPLKLSVDGKKISRGKCKEIGDVDCWGYEASPSLAERKDELKKDIAIIESMQERLDILEEKGIENINDIPSQTVNEFISVVKTVTRCLGLKNKALREKYASLEHAEDKFKKLGEPDWKSSRFYPIICSIRVSKTEIKSQICESLKIVDDLAFYCSVIQDKQELFCKSTCVDIQKQINLHQLNKHYSTDDSRFICQRTEKWFQIRKGAKVTGSTCNAAVGLGKLKEQQKHIDRVFGKGDEDNEPDDVIKQRMEFGVQHELDAIATVTGRVLPFLYPGLQYFEEGCVKIASKNQEDFMIVSPDGSLRSTSENKPDLMYENKCKAPSSYNPTAYYSIPHYYVTQLLSEMFAYNCQEMLFTCWSLQSMTVFLVKFDQELWNTCWKELERVYDGETAPRLTRFSDSAKDMKISVKSFVETNGTFVGEFSSCIAINKEPNETPSSECFSSHIENNSAVEYIALSLLQDCTAHVKKWLQTTYDLLRTVASEILVFMLNDLDRVYNMETSNAHPVAYALKGPSMSTDVLRQMMKEVIKQCENHGLNILITASDGQWHLYGVRDNAGRPMTVHQLQKDHWKIINSRSKSELLSNMKCMFNVERLSLLGTDQENRKLVIYKSGTRIPVFVKDNWGRNDESTDLSNNSDSLDDDQRNDVNVLSQGCFDGDLENELEDDLMQQVDKVFTELTTNEKQNNSKRTVESPLEIGNWFYNSEYEPPLSVSCENDISTDDLCSHEVNNSFYYQAIGSVTPENDVHSSTDFDHTFEKRNNCTSSDSFIFTAYNVLYGTDESDTSREMMPCNSINECADNAPCHLKQNIYQSSYEVNQMSNQDQSEHQNGENNHVLNVNHFKCMHTALQQDEKSMNIHDWSKLSLMQFVSLFVTKEALNKSFQKHELSICCKSIQEMVFLNGEEWSWKWTKYKMVDVLSGLKKEVMEPQEIYVPPLKKHGKAKDKSEFEKWNKQNLAIVVAELEWNKVYTDWRTENPASRGIILGDSQEINVEWFSRPCKDSNGSLRFHFTDACHILTCLRTKICTTGIKGLSRKAWEMAALSKETNLNISVVVDCVDKQDVALARRLFDTDVENAMTNEFKSEAQFCRLIRNWFNAEDEPAISAETRCRHRLELRQWLMDGYNIGSFPPPTRYVRGIPIVTFEALVSHTERKLQLYDYVPGNAYNVRATGSQEVEQFFSTFRDMDPSGKGTPKPDVIPEMMRTVIEIENFRLNPEKPFHMKISRAEVYPSTTYLSEKQGPTSINGLSSTAAVSDITTGSTFICPRNHSFDQSERGERRHKRKKGVITKPGEPAHGEHGVRQYHARDDSKMLAHRRLGLLDLPE